MKYTNKDIAKEYARMGLKVFPLRIGKGLGDSLWKRPVYKGGFHNATTNGDSIDQLWKNPNFGIGLALGRFADSQFLSVIEYDLKSAGDSSWADLCRKHPELTVPTVTVTSGSGGKHFYYLGDTAVRCTVGDIAPGVDTRGEGGYVVLPPSIHKSGNRYRWDKGKDPGSIPFQPFPRTLLDYMKKAKEARGARKSAKKQEWKGRFDGLPEVIPEGERNDTLFRWGCGVVRSFSPEYVESMLDKANRERCSPPLDDIETETLLRSIEAKRPEDWRPHLVPLRNYYLEERTETVRQIVDEDDETEKPIAKAERRPLVDYDDDLRAQAKYFYRIVDSDNHGEMYLDNAFAISSWTHSGEIKTKYALRNAFRCLGRRTDFISQHKGAKIQEEDYLDWLRNNCRVYDRLHACNEYPADPKTLYLSENVVARKTGRLREMCDTFTVANVKSACRICAGILSSYLPRKYDGERPLHAVVGPAQSVGKTTVVKTCSMVTTDKPPIMISPRGNNSEAFGSVDAIANPVILLDNLTGMRREDAEDIARWVTSRTLQIHIMYSSHGFYPNHWTWWATFNDEHALTSDLLARAVIIEMRGWSDLPLEEQAKSKNEVSKRLLELIDEREEILADIAWTFEQEKNAQPYAHKAHPKYVMWSDRMARLLHIVYPEVAEFDFSISEEEKGRFDEDFGIFNEVLERIKAEPMEGEIDQEFLGEPKEEPENWYSDDYVFSRFYEVARGAKWAENKYNLGKKINAMAKRLSGWRIKKQRLQVKKNRKLGWTIEEVNTGGEKVV